MRPKNIFLFFLFLFLFLFLIKIFDVSYPLTVVTTTKTSELAITGEGKVEAVPDTAYIDTGVTITNAPTALEVQKAIDKINNQIISQMKNLGIDKQDIKTANYSIYPNYDYSDQTNKISGYNGNVLITIKTQKLNLLSSIIENATKAGANQIQGVRFVIDKPELYREKAREEAIKNAKTQAQKLASRLGIKLGKVDNIIEAAPEATLPFYQKYTAAGLGGPTERTEIEPGSQTIVSTVTLYFQKR